MKEILTMKKTVAKLLLLSVILTGILTGLGVIIDNTNDSPVVTSGNLFDDETVPIINK